MQNSISKLYVFDLDGTLALSKMAIDSEMAELLTRLLKVSKVAVISGGAFPQFEKQFLSNLKAGPDELKNLFILPTNGTQFYRYENEWNRLYNEELTTEEKKNIFSAFDETFKKVGFIPQNVHGVLIEDRGSQVTFSAHGSTAPLGLKEAWDPDQKKRLPMREILATLLPDLEVRLGGTTSIDITRKGIDKAYGMRKLMNELGVSVDEITYIGDALYPGGNDASVIPLGVKTIQVDGPEDTKKVVREIIGN